MAIIESTKEGLRWIGIGLAFIVAAPFVLFVEVRDRIKIRWMPAEELIAGLRWFRGYIADTPHDVARQVVCLIDAGEWARIIPLWRPLLTAIGPGCAFGAPEIQAIRELRRRTRRSSVSTLE